MTRGCPEAEDKFVLVPDVDPLAPLIRMIFGVALPSCLISTALNLEPGNNAFTGDVSLSSRLPASVRAWPMSSLHKWFQNVNKQLLFSTNVNKQLSVFLKCKLAADLM